MKQLPFITALLLLSGLLPSFAFAQTTPSTVSTHTSAQIARAQARANQEITRRITALNSLSSRIQSMTRVSDTLRQALEGNVQNQVQLLTTLQSKIAADTDVATLKADVQSIVQSYRIYMLVLPQGRISAEADRIATITAMMQGIGNKLQARLQTASQGGADISAPTSLLTDLGAKIVDAQNQAQAAINTIAPLAPDNGNKTILAQNTTALQEARADLKTARTDLVAGRQDIAGILKFLASVHTSASASSTTAQQ